MGILDNFSLEGKVALVTGASYGIGFAIATAFAEAGATIVFNDIRQELVDKGLASYEEKGIKAHGYVCDVTNEEQVEAMVAQIEKEHEERYRELAENLKNNKVFAREEQQVWQCRNCGYTYIGKSAPLKCPVCAHPQSYFELKKHNY